MKRKLTHEEFVEKLLKKNKHFANSDFDLIGRYTGSQDKILCHCHIHNYNWNAIPADLCRDRGCPLCGQESSVKNRTSPYEEYIVKLHAVLPNVDVVGKYISESVATTFQCDKGHKWDNQPRYVLHSASGCPYCSGQKVWIGFNDMWTTRPDVAKLLNNPSDGYKYTYGSTKKAEFVCPDCGMINYKRISDVSGRGLCCNYCSDGISYPNKFSRAFLKQLPVANCKPEYQPDWAKPYFYDNYFEYKGKQYILEMDGGFHYEEMISGHKMLEERQRIDALKTSLATQNGVKIIRIECKVSDCEYIKNNILKSGLNDIFDLSNIDWNLCDISAQKSLVKEVCNLYCSGVHKINEIAKMLNIGLSTATRYLQRGAKLGLCDYQFKQYKIKQKTKEVT